MGENCFNRVVLTRHQLKLKKSEGEKYLPSDLCVCFLKTVVQCLQNDFKNYFEGLHLSSENKLWKNSELKITYNHDVDCSSNDKKKLT